jgi:hypothetical protein
MAGGTVSSIANQQHTSLTASAQRKKLDNNMIGQAQPCMTVLHASASLSCVYSQL